MGKFHHHKKSDVFPRTAELWTGSSHWFPSLRYANFLFEGDVERLMPHLERAMEVLPQVGEVGAEWRKGLVKDGTLGPSPDT